MRYVYVIRNLINDKVYVGQTRNFAKRKAGHLYGVRKGVEHPLYHSIRKHGEENFSFEILEECEDVMINEREIHWISHFNSFNSEKGYNLTPGGDGGGWLYVNQNESLRKEKNKRAARAMNAKTWADPEFRKRNSKRMSVMARRLHKEGRSKAPDWTGKTHKEESKRKIGIANSVQQRGEKNSQFGKIWIHNDFVSKFVKADELQQLLDLGWKRGRKMSF